MFIAVGIDDEHYADLYYKISDDLNDVLNYMESLSYVDYGKMTWTFPVKNADHVARGEAGGAHKFFVTEVFNVSRLSPFFLIHWHAYDGVSFGVEEFESIEAAKTEIERRWNEDQELYFEDTCEDSNFLDDDESIFDTGYEWKMHKIVRNERSN